MKHKVLLVDDDTVYYESQKSAALFFEIELEHKDNWEDAERILTASPDLYAAIVVDGKGKLRPEERGEDQRQVGKALQWLAKEKGAGRHATMVINTGYLKDIKLIQDFEGIPVFEKGNETSSLFPFLVHEINNKQQTKVKEKFSDVCSCFDDKILPSSYWKKIELLLIKWDQAKFEKKDFNDMRDILESLLKSANKIDNAVLLPNTLMNLKDGRPTLGFIEHYWQEKDVIVTDKISGTKKTIQAKCPKRILPEELSSCLISLVKNVQAFSHDKTPPNKFIYQATINSLFAIILWFKAFVATNYPKY
jgi:hypothetical protein